MKDLDIKRYSPIFSEVWKFFKEEMREKKLSEKEWDELLDRAAMLNQKLGDTEFSKYMINSVIEEIARRERGES